MPTERTDVGVVGYGPVGQLVAILLARAGHRVTVLERRPEPYPLPRAVHFDHEVARILQGAGVMTELAGRTEAATIYEWRNAAGQVLLRFGRERGTGLCGWPDSTMFCQPDLERILDARARSFANVSVHRGVEVVALSETAGGVSLTGRGTDGIERRLEARYVVGSDGANSFVRQAIGVPTSDLGFAFDWLVVDLLPKEPRTWEPMNWQLCDPARPTTLVSGGPGRRRFEFMRLPSETIESLNDEGKAWTLLAPWGFTPETAVLERHAVYTFRGRWSEPWRKGRVLLAGDAAHLMPPFAGQGLCSGLRDAANLAWKLDLVLGGRAGEALLDTYTSERLPHVRAIIDFSVALGRVICIADPEEAAARDRAMAATASAGGVSTPAPLPPIGPGCFAQDDPHAGRVFLQARVERAGRTGLFDDVVGGGFVLVSPEGDPLGALGPEAAAWFASLGGRSAHVGVDAEVRDVEGEYARWFAAAGVGLALQRPDGILFGTGASVADAPRLVAELRRHLAG